MDADDREATRLLGARIDHLDLEYVTLSREYRYALDLRGAEIGELSLGHAESTVPIDLRDAEIDHLNLDNAAFKGEFHAAGARIGSVDAFEATFERDANFASATIEQPAEFDQAVFDDESHFNDVRFEGAARFRGATFHGGSNLLGDNSSFAGATFLDETDFQQARFETTTFDEATFEAVVRFQEAVFDGDVSFKRVTFEGPADFDEARFEGDTSFEGAGFRASAAFRGVSFRGGNRVLEADVSFVDVTFAEQADFQHASFRGADFAGATFAARAVFEKSIYRKDASFGDVTFEGSADFDEARFEGDTHFRAAAFENTAVFRGVEFLGDDNQLEDNASFEDVQFRATADFDGARFTTANFQGVSFNVEASFAGVDIVERAEFAPSTPSGWVVVDLTDVSFPAGFLRQQADPTEWVAYDLTRVVLGDVRIETAGDADGRALLRSVRFCETEFDGFDFSAHRGLFEVADWTLHEFDTPAGYEPAHDLTPRARELTYLRAATAAKAQGDRDAGVEFSILKALNRREKNLALANDPELPLARRLTKAGEVLGNFAWHLSCGYGYRLSRILVVSAAVVVSWGVMYALLPLVDPSSGTTDKIAGITDMGQLATLEGWRVVLDNVYFSLVTFTTVGYGDVNPVGTAKGLAAVEGALGVLLASLVVFVLGRRVAI